MTGTEQFIMGTWIGFGVGITTGYFVGRVYGGKNGRRK